jgi:hypothetical protein
MPVPSWLNTARQQAARYLPDRCTIANVPGDTALTLTDVPCQVKALAPQTAITDDGAGGTITTVLQRWDVTIPAGYTLPQGKARINVTVEGVSHSFETVTRVPQGESQAVTLTMQCEEVFGG